MSFSKSVIFINEQSTWRLNRPIRSGACWWAAGGGACADRQMDVSVCRRSAALTESRKWWFTSWAFIHASSQMNKDGIRVLWAPLSDVYMSSARRDLCLQQRRKEKTTTNEVAWKCILMLRQQQTQRGMMGVRGRFILMKDKVINVLKLTEMCLTLHNSQSELKTTTTMM